MLPHNYWCPIVKGAIHAIKLSTWTGTIMGKYGKLTAMRQLVEIMRQLLQEVASEPTKLTELMLEGPECMAFVD